VLSFDYLKAKIRSGERLTFDEGVFLYKEGPILELGELAAEQKTKRMPDDVVTFVVDSNPNYTNVCTYDCVFCAFYRHADAPDAYTLDHDEVLKKIKWSAERGATTVLLQGGVHPDLPLEYYTGLVKKTRELFPKLTPHFFSAPEIWGMAEVSGLRTREVLARLKEAGQHTLPGGGAEMLSDRVRRKFSREKGVSAKWLEVHREAHELGFRSTATMMYGHIETPEDVITHLDSIRSLQDDTGGFTAFIPWSFKPGNTKLEKHIPFYAGANAYLRMLSVSRLYLDNFDHVQASWFSEGKKAGQVALHFGADDFGGTLFEEHVHEATGFVNHITVEEVVTLIKEAGFRPAQRTTLYEIIRYY